MKYLRNATQIKRKANEKKKATHAAPPSEHFEH